MFSPTLLVYVLILMAIDCLVCCHCLWRAIIISTASEWWRPYCHRHINKDKSIRHNWIERVYIFRHQCRYDVDLWSNNIRPAADSCIKPLAGRVAVLPQSTSYSWPIRDHLHYQLILEREWIETDTQIRREFEGSYIKIVTECLLNIWVTKVVPWNMISKSQSTDYISGTLCGKMGK